MSKYAPRFWWVNHKQTFKAEVEGGYIWSPKANQNGARNQTYDNLTLVQSGDIVVSYADTLIKTIGIVTGAHHEAPKPEAFGLVGENWSNIGWLVPVEWVLLKAPLSPKAHIVLIQPLLPVKNSPLQASGNGNQGCYLAHISLELGHLILQLAKMGDSSAVQIISELKMQTLADEQQRAIESAADTPETVKEQLIRARCGQGLFRQKVLAIEPRCRLTGVDDQSFLIASHIRPWRDCENDERLDGNNGLMLAPHVDKLFDRGWISFEDSGDLLVAKVAEPVLEAWGIKLSINVGTFTAKQVAYLAYHRKVVFRGKHSV
ncbi:HNH endonuclease [Azomonas macrocytogenes]|uniref:HNH nuclease domain-containing protein n=1 Tax=Azomonas macrocytogenes TaxID=69962 RepID=A0A839T2G0_AZOMA|nr:HNH endonuclease [Azomonas macrocytogenes]MBB3103737.1 hypothetical protein [Azomonas macrocytogenes]